MYYKSKKISLTILFLTAVVFSLVSTVFFRDPENQTIISGLVQAVLVYVLSLAVYLCSPSTKPTDIGNQLDPIGVSALEHLSLIQYSGIKRLLFVVAIQAVLVAGFVLYWN